MLRVSLLSEQEAAPQSQGCPLRLPTSPGCNPTAVEVLEGSGGNREKQHQPLQALCPEESTWAMGGERDRCRRMGWVSVPNDRSKMQRVVLLAYHRTSTSGTKSILEEANVRPAQARRGGKAGSRPGIGAVGHASDWRAALLANRGPAKLAHHANFGRRCRARRPHESA
jgi:hypothetical protein